MQAVKPWLPRVVLVIHACILWSYSKAEASHCTEDQIKHCQSAALENKIRQLPGGGLCTPNSYVEYTHVCAVSSYLQSADYCCCSYEQRVMCCRYHYDDIYFRCDESEDTISAGAPESSLPLQVLLPAILVPSVVGLCLLFYCLKCCCCNSDDDDEDEGGLCRVKVCIGKRKHRKYEKPSQPSGPGAEPRNSLLNSSSFTPAPHPLATGAVSQDEEGPILASRTGVVPTDFIHGPRCHPSAPPFEAYLDNNGKESGLIDPPPAYERVPSARETLLYYRPRAPHAEEYGADICVMAVADGEPTVVLRPGIDLHHAHHLAESLSIAKS